MPRRQSERFRDEVPLPEGWDVEKDVDGKPFFIDHNTQQTTWVDPRDRYVTAFYSCQTVISREFDWKPLSAAHGTKLTTNSGHSPQCTNTLIDRCDVM